MNRSAQLFRTASKAVRVLAGLEQAIHQPTAAERKALLAGFAMKGKILYGASYDAIQLKRLIDLSSPEDIAANIDAIKIFEIKSTNQGKIGEDLSGYFFNITSAELLVAQGLGDQYRFAFVNIVNHTWQELSISEVLGKAKAVYPAFHIRF